MIRIDGSYGEGGGQIIRTSLSLAAMTGQAVEITNVRAGRSKPGLQPQHLASVKAAAEICSARLEGAAVGSTRILFEPGGPVKAGTYHFDIGTAGAAPLVAQTALIPLSYASGASQVTIVGGTHVPHAPPAEYLEAVYLPALRRAGLSVRYASTASGFFPRGGGRLEIGIEPSPPDTPLDYTNRGKLRRLKAFVVTSQLPAHVAERGKAAIETFMKGVGRKIEVECRDLPSNGPGAAVVVTAECAGGYGGFSSIGARGKPMEKVAEEPCAAFMAWWKSEAACDEHLADQLVLPMVRAKGGSAWSTPVVTEHLRTVLWVAGQFVSVSVHLEEQAGGTVVKCEGEKGGEGGWM